jgi:hypothetical protein
MHIHILVIKEEKRRYISEYMKDRFFPKIFENEFDITFCDFVRIIYNPC